jgi:hypothetical protein
MLGLVLRRITETLPNVLPELSPNFGDGRGQAAAA